MRRSKIVKSKAAIAVPNLADTIESYLLAQLMRQGVTRIELQRVRVARSFGCAPSQVTYVLSTRFTRERGFVVESKRGGGGFVRITRLVSRGQFLRDVLRATEGGVRQGDASGLLVWLEREELVTGREAALLRAAVDRETIALPGPQRDLLRGRLLRAMIMALFAGDLAPIAVRPTQVSVALMRRE